MAIEQLLAVLEQDAEAERQTILAEARSEADRIRREAAERATERRAQLLAPRERAWRQAAALAVEEARQQGRTEILAARAGLLDRIFAMVRSRLPAMLRDSRYHGALADQLADALTYVGDQPCIVRCPPPIGDTLRSITAGREAVTVVEDPNAPPGFTVRSPEDRVVVDQTLEGRLERLQSILALQSLSDLQIGP